MTKPAARTRAPGPRPRYVGEYVVALQRDKLGLFGSMARHGDVSMINIGPRRVVLLMDPDDIQRMLVGDQRKFTKGRALSKTRRLLGNGLLTSEGDFHLRQRRLVQPAFHRDRIRGYAAAMLEATERVQRGWKAGEVRDVHAEMMHLTLDIAGSALFSADVRDEVEHVAQTLELSLRMANLQLIPFAELLEYVPVRWVRELHRSRARMDALIFRLITRGRERGDDGGDLLSMLIAARDAEGDGAGMTDRQLRDELVTLLLAAHETTANALTWSWYLLSQHPAAEARMHAEIGAALGDRPLTVNDLPALRYTRAVMAESMRLFPPAWTLERLVMEPFEAGGYTLKPGTTVLACQYLVHRDPRWWPDAERFDPARWLEPAPGRPKFAYFPFGAGTRVCVGEQFAWMEGTLALASIAQRWSLRYAGQGIPEPEPLITLRPKGGMPMVLTPRGRAAGT